MPPQLAQVSPTYYRVTCEEIEDEEDLIAICGLRWREPPQPLSAPILKGANEFCMDAETDSDNEYDNSGHSITNGLGLGARGGCLLRSYASRIAPMIAEAKLALIDLERFLHPP